jgi:hypothetical protein
MSAPARDKTQPRYQQQDQDHFAEAGFIKARIKP